MTQILGFSGKKMSGKNTSANFILGNVMKSLDLIEWMKINTKGELEVPAYDEEHGLQEAMINPESEKTKAWLNESIGFALRLYSNADALKQFLINVLGLTYPQCYGRNEDKDSLTKIRWEDFPGVMTNEYLFNDVTHEINHLVEEVPNTYTDENFVLTYHEPGFMTARQVMQMFGTNVCRRLYGNCWVDSLIREIRKTMPALAVVTDCRFPNEVVGIQAAGGKMIRFLRAPMAGEDEHESETALDDFPLEDFDAVIDNRKMSIPEQNRAVAEKLEEWGFVTVGEESLNVATK